MLLIHAVLDTTELARVREALAKAPSADGRATAGWAAQAVKHNRQFERSHAATRAAATIVQAALGRHELLQAAARPLRFGPLLFNRYESGMGYGTHVDDAVMQADQGSFRSDLSYTLFLSAPGDYHGGELVIESAGAEHAVKLEAGDLVLYPSTELHRVEPVTMGLRLAAVGWVQSQVRDSAQRELLFDLAQVRRALQERHGPSRELDLLHRANANLLRMWAEL